MQPVYWLILFVLLLLIEVFTMGLTTIWFAGGALVAMVICMLGGNIWLQCIGGLAVSFLLLLFTRPFAVRYINQKHVRTNADGLVGQNACVTAGKTVEVVKIEGVKLIVKEKEN